MYRGHFLSELTDYIAWGIKGSLWRDGHWIEVIGLEGTSYKLAPAGVEAVNSLILTS